jgi:uncharacterized phage protein (TIGR02220 family)
MKIQSLMNAGSWLPYNREMAVAFGADVAFLFSELCHLSEQFHSERMDGWFFVPSGKLAELTGLKRTPLERCLATLCSADLLMIDARGIHNTRHFKLEQKAEAISAICAAFAAAPAQTPDRAPKTAPRPKQTANTAKEAPNQSEQPLEMVEPVGKTEQLPAEKPKKPKANPAEIDAAAVRLIEHFNAVAGTAFRTTGKANIECFGRVLKAKEGTEEEIRMVIELKAMQWANNENMKSHLNPETLTRPKNFPRYLEECYNAKAQQSTPRPSVGNFAARDNNLTIELPNGQVFGTGYNRADMEKIRMVISHLHEHPGIQKHLPPRLASPDYLSALSVNDLRFELKQARFKHQSENFQFPSSDELPF